MRFNDYKTLYELTRAEYGSSFVGTQELFYGLQIEVLESQDALSEADAAQYFALNSERHWYRICRPYYDCYPYLMDRAFDFDPGDLRVDQIPDLPESALAVRFPEGSKYQSLLMSRAACEFGSKESFFCVSGIYPDGDRFFYEIPLVNGNDLREMVSAAGERSGFTRAAIFLSLAFQSTELLEPVLVKRFAGLPLEEAVRRSESRRGGQKIYSLGKSLEEEVSSSPHYRRPHPALYWTGAGRKTPTIVFRSGSIVNRKKVTEVPTGYLDREAGHHEVLR